MTTTQSNTMEGTVHIISLDQRPCVVHYLEHYNKFVVGTYELFSSLEDARLKLNSHMDESQLRKVLDGINKRAGKLILLRSNDVSTPSIEYEFDCQAGGGVFDAKVRYNKLDSSYNIYVAHSNGTIGIYKLTLHCGNKICLKEHIRVEGAKMLTCIDILSEPTPSSIGGGSESGALAKLKPADTPLSSSSGSSLSSTSTGSACRLDLSSPISKRLVVGDSSGYITVVDRGRSTRVQVTKDDSIWQVKVLHLASGRDVIVVCAENSCWYIYAYDDLMESLLLLYKNEFKDFSAGITSVHVLEVMRLDEYDLFELLLGSYDESLQTYHVKLKHDGNSKPDVCHKNTISINNGGIWRIKPFRGNNTKQLCISAMYAGSYILTLAGIAEESLNPIIDIESLKMANKSLHYDIDVSCCNKTFCIADFNNSLCILKTIDT